MKKTTSPSSFKSKTVTKIFGITLRQLDYWVRTDLIKPSIMPAEGRGSTRIFNFVDLIQISTTKALLDGGMSIQQIRKSAQFIYEKLGEKIPLTARLITDGDTIFKVVNDNKEFLHAIDTLNHQGQGVFLLSIVPIGKLSREVEKKVKQLNIAA